MPDLQPMGEPLATNTLSNSLTTDSVLRQQLMSMISTLATAEFQNRLDSFRAHLKQFDLEVFDACQKVPYAPKDWWRDPHDIFVNQSLQIIVRYENSSGRFDLLPDWLVTASILHDRGYGVLASNQGATTDQYLKRSGAHWENPDTRILHSLLSREFASSLIFSEEGLLYAKRSEISNPELFLKVIETHDHPLIGRFPELPEVGRHHFDADSLFSISLVSFVKDYLSYLDDPKKLQKATDSGLAKSGMFTASDLLQARIARYYPSELELPNNWNANLFPLESRLASFSEAGQCLPPSSPTAKSLTDSCFLDLADCCVQLATLTDLKEFEVWFEKGVAAQFSKLQKLLELKEVNVEFLKAN